MGSANIKASSENVIVSQPSQIIRNAKTGRVVTAGQEAAAMNPELPRERVFARRGEKLVDYQAAQRVIELSVNSLLSWWTLLRPHVLIAVHSQATVAEIRQLKKAARVAGAYSAYTAESVSLAALGSGIESDDSTGRLVLDIGAKKTEAAVVVRGNPVVTKIINTGGDDFVNEIIAHVEDAYQHTLSESEARRLLEQVGAAIPKDTPDKMTVSASEGSVDVSGNDVAAGISNLLQEVVQLVQRLMRSTSAALLADISNSGVTMVGGVAQLDYLDVYLSRRLSVPVKMATDPATAVVRGGGKAWAKISQHPQYPQLAQLQK
jgi:rod shape-determining protein MreB